MYTSRFNSRDARTILNMEKAALDGYTKKQTRYKKTAVYPMKSESDRSPLKFSKKDLVIIQTTRLLKEEFGQKDYFFIKQLIHHQQSLVNHFKNIKLKDEYNPYSELFGKNLQEKPQIVLEVSKLGEIESDLKTVLPENMIEDLGMSLDGVKAISKSTLYFVQLNNIEENNKYSNYACSETYTQSEEYVRGKKVHSSNHNLDPSPELLSEFEIFRLFSLQINLTNISNKIDAGIKIVDREEELN